jgi:predicted dehydrogenase
MSKKKTQIGMIGCGMIAQAHMQNFADDRRTEIRWIADLNEKTLNDSAVKFDVPNTTANYADMLNDDALDAVVVCTPPLSHLKIGTDALKAGKHLLMEKPLATSVSDAKKLLRAADKHPDLKVSGCSCRHARLNPKFEYVRKMISDGKLGDVYFVHHRGVNRQGRPGLEYNPTAKWFLNRDIAGGGPLYDWGVYDMSFHLGILDEPKLVKADGICVNGLDKVDPGTDVFTVEEHGIGFMTFEGGMKYYWERANHAHASIPNRTTIYGTEGGLQFGYCTWEGPEIEFLYVDRKGKGKAKSKTLTVNLKRHKGDMQELGQAFIKYLLDEGPVPMPMDIEVKNLEIIHKVYRVAGW